MPSRWITAVAALFFLSASAMPGDTIADDSPFVLVLGIAQDAGYPQTGCYQPHCMPGWQDPGRKRLVSSIAVVDPSSGSKLVFDATPDFREQLYALHRAAPDGEYSLDGIFLTHAHMGHYTGLMHVGYESMNAKGIPVYVMPRMAAYLSGNGPWDQLVRYGNIELRELTDGKAVDANPSIRVTPLKVPHRDEYSETVGFRIDGPNKSALFIPDIDKWGHWDTDIRNLVRDVDYALIDATFFDDGELPGRDMSKVLHPFVAESMALFEGLTEEQKARVIFIHFNHSNPLLQPGSDAAAEVEARGFRVAFEGMRLGL